MPKDKDVEEIKQAFKEFEKAGNSREWKKWKNWDRGESGISAIYCLGVLGALVYFIQHAANFGDGLIGIVKAIGWPAVVVYKVLETFGL